MMASAGRLALKTRVKVISQFSPLPSALVKAGVSSQSMSTPSNWLSVTNLANFCPQSVASTPAEVGVWVDPKALTKSLTPALVKFFLRVVWISELVVPQPLGPMLEAIFAHIPEASWALPGQVQKVRAMQLQGRGVLVKPGTPKAAGRVIFPHHEVNRLMQMNLTGAEELAFPFWLGLTMRSMVSAEPRESRRRMERQSNSLLVDMSYLQQN